MTNPAPLPPKSGGMPKWLIILIIILLVIFVGCCGGISACFFFARKAAQTAATAIPAAIQEAQQQAEARAGVQIDTTGNGIALPDNFPADVSPYTGLKATSKVAPPASDHGVVVFEGTAPAQTIADFYKSSLTSKGWSQDSSSTTGNLIAESFSKDDQKITFVITGSATTTVTVTYGKK